ncbi:MAG: aldo/keto reductase [Acetobacteraceae bacterium]|nr:aldo/keto reductase [Acetobacteraceae bacterium]
MEVRNLGRSGLRVSSIGLGCNNFGGRINLEASRAVVHAALDAGITLLDTADVYGERGGSETTLGEILGPRRKDIVLATKFAMPMDPEETLKGASRRYIISAVEASLKRLRTDWIDLYQQHRPDRLTPIEETLRALEDLTRAGKIRYAGCSNFAGWQVADAVWTARDLALAGFVSCQDELSLVVRKHEADLMPAMRHYGLGLLPYFPLASGLLTGKYKRNDSMPADARLTKTQRLADRYLTEQNWTIAERLAEFAQARGHSMLELAFSWLLSRDPVSSVIAGATKPEQVAANVQAGGWKLTEDELAEIDKLTGAEVAQA